MNHYVYEITNLVNGKKYIGKRSCKCPIEDDKYMGSGKLLKKAINKYGSENFRKEILHICENEKMAFEWEKIYIEQVKAYENNNYYNIAKGGEGGWGVFAGKTEEEMAIRMSKIISKNKGRIVSDETRKKLSLAHSRCGNGYYNKKHSEETKKRLSLIFKERFKDKTKHPSYGKKWAEGTHPCIGRKLSDETKLKLSAIRKSKYTGENHPWYGRKHTEESKLKNRNSQLREKGNRARKVICLNNSEIFDCIKSVNDKYGIDPPCITKVCKGKRKSAGKINGEPAKWMYYEDYLNMKNKKA